MTFRTLCLTTEMLYKRQIHHLLTLTKVSEPKGLERG